MKKLVILLFCIGFAFQIGAYSKYDVKLWIDGSKRFIKADFSGLVSGTPTKTVLGTYEGDGVIGLDFENMGLVDANFSNVSTGKRGEAAEGGSFNNSNLTNANFTKAQLWGIAGGGGGTTFHKTNLTGANFTDANLQGCYFWNAILAGANFTNANLTKINFKEAVLGAPGASKRAVYANANLSGVNLSVVSKKVPLANINFGKANLSGANLSGLKFVVKTVSFVSANLTNANMSNTTVASIDFSKANCTGTNFNKADLTASIFKGATFDKTNFTQANLTQTDFSGVTLKGVNCTKANFTKTNLQGTTFSGVNLTGAQFKDTNFTGTKGLLLSALQTKDDAVTTQILTMGYILTSDAITQIGNYLNQNSSRTKLGNQLIAIGNKIKPLQEQYDKANTAYLAIAQTDLGAKMAAGNKLEQYDIPLRQLRVTEKNYKRNLKEGPAMNNVFATYLQNVGQNLMQAITSGDSTKAVLLIKQVEQITSSQMIVLFALHGNEQPLTYHDVTTNMSQILLAAKQNLPGVVKALIDAKVKIDLNQMGPGISGQNFSPLMWAAYNIGYTTDGKDNGIKVAKALIAAGADTTSLPPNAQLTLKNNAVIK
jgi:uncharacterized protein YjbI with pentapeptide repeats